MSTNLAEVAQQQRRTLDNMLEILGTDLVDLREMQVDPDLVCIWAITDQIEVTIRKLARGIDSHRRWLKRDRAAALVDVATLDSIDQQNRRAGELVRIAYDALE